VTKCTFLALFFARPPFSDCVRKKGVGPSLAVAEHPKNDGKTCFYRYLGWSQQGQKGHKTAKKDKTAFQALSDHPKVTPKGHFLAAGRG